MSILSKTLKDKSGNTIFPKTKSTRVICSNNLSLDANLDIKAPLASPAFTGSPTTTTPTNTDSSTKIASTAYVKSQFLSVNFTLLSTGWTGSAAPYTYTITVSGVTATNQGSVGLADSATDEQYNAATAAMIRKYAQDANSLSFKCYGDKPTVNIPCTVMIVG